MIRRKRNNIDFCLLEVHFKSKIGYPVFIFLILSESTRKQSIGYLTVILFIASSWLW